MPERYQSVCKGRNTMNALIVLLGLISAALALPAHFPHGKTVTYKYSADVKAGVTEPAPFASQFGIDCRLHVKHDDTDPSLKNAYLIALTDVKHGLHNGHAMHHDQLPVTQPIVEDSKAIQTPFLIVYDENGQLQGVKLMEKEPGWSKNIKKSIASLLQLDLPNIFDQSPRKAHSFITHEETIHGTCQVAYNIHDLDQAHQPAGNVFVVTKVHEPENCTQFSHQVFNHIEPESCHVEEENGMATGSRRMFEIEDHTSHILIKKLIGHSTINYVPWMAKSEAHYLSTNQTFILENVAPTHEVQLPTVNLRDVPVTRNIFYKKSQLSYAPQADVDVTHGRHVLSLGELSAKLKKMLDEAAGYLKESHIEKKQPDWKHGQTINRIHHVMSFLDLQSLEKVYDELQGTADAKGTAMKNIFLGTVANVGTKASCIFVRNVIRAKSVSNASAILMLNQLPMHVKVPSVDLLLQMEELLNFGENVAAPVREASIFCFATLIHKTFKDEPNVDSNPLLTRYLDHFMDHVKNEPSYHMKTVYLMALKNVRLSGILKHLEPIIRGDLVLTDTPHNIRFMAIWAISPVVVDLPHYTHDLLWPILSNVTLPVAIRIAAYDVLMNQLPHGGRFMNIQWLMANEKDEDLYNYHVDTVEGLANSVDPCLAPVREMARKVLVFTKKRPVVGTLSRKIHVDYMDEKYGHGEAMKLSLVMEPLTGFPYVGSMEQTTNVARKPFTRGIYWNVNGLTNILKDLSVNVFGTSGEPIKNVNAKNILTKAAKDMLHVKPVNIDLIATVNGNVISMFHADTTAWQKMLDDLKQWQNFVTQMVDNLNYQTIVYQNHYEMQVPTDLGVPAILSTKMPMFTSMKVNVAHSEDQHLINGKLMVKYMNWMHGEYAMSVYNPIADTWHSVRRTSSQDIVLPLEMHVGLNLDTKSLKFTFPRLPVSEYSVAGISSYAKNYVTISDDETDMLKTTCPTCRHHELVAGEVNPRIHESVVDSKDTGLKFTAAVYDCEGNVTPVPPASEFMRNLMDEHKSTMGYKWVQVVMAIRQQMMRDVISGQGMSCSSMIKVEPSIVHPASMIDLSGKLSIQNWDKNEEKLNFLSTKKIDVRATVNVKAAATNESVRQWDMNAHVLLSQGHVSNIVKLMITRTTPGEKNLIICLEAQKDFLVDNSHLLNVDLGKKETNTKVLITMGQTSENKCVRDDMDVTVTVKGEMSDEQKKRIEHDNVHGMCVKQAQNPLFGADVTNLPKTWACLQQGILHSTLRKYTANMTLRKVPSTVMSTVNIAQDVCRAILFPDVKYSWDHAEPGTAKVVLEYPYQTSVLDAAFVTPTHSYEVVQVPFGHPMWTMWMDNTHYEFTQLRKCVNGQTKFCTMLPRVLTTMDNGTMPFIVPEKWTLMSGDIIGQTFSVFIKSVPKGKLALKVYVAEHELEVMPTDAGVTVTMNNKVVDNWEKGVLAPENEHDSYAIRVTKAYGHLVIDSTLVPMQIFSSPDSVLFALDDGLQGHVSGMCGHMDRSHKIKIPKIYSATSL